VKDAAYAYDLRATILHCWAIDHQRLIFNF
jgi:hypothetical protein